ncbi:unnamed protein product [Arctia plantaginis]|uniref:Uncharacterized protein n=1 Tax=Arctia plantaginis TaxID=874455 RepID=A0A8S1A9V1_ARCPL|nr:unnamed protein product [Arctia plantaginis]
MKTSLFLFFNYFILIKIVEAQLGPIRPGTLKTPGPIEGSKEILPTPASNRPPSLERMTPKCYPETAKAYFLPAPPVAPIVTILDTNSMDIASNFRSSFKELSSSPPVSPQLSINQVGFVPPPIQVLPDLIDEVPLLIQDRFSRLAESEDVGTVCDTCALVAKLPIYNFDQELLNGFLAGLGL